MTMSFQRTDLPIIHHVMTSLLTKNAEMCKLVAVGGYTTPGCGYTDNKHVVSRRVSARVSGLSTCLMIN